MDPDGSGNRWLVNAPLVGPGVQSPEYRGRVSIYIYQPGDWKRFEVTDAEEGVLHGVEPVVWENAKSEALLSAGFLGVHLYQHVEDRWTGTLITRGDPAEWPGSGTSDVAMGHLLEEPFIATIEPWHGPHVVIYRQQTNGWARRVIDNRLEDGHAVEVGDFDGDGRDEVIAGERRGTHSVYLYRNSPDTNSWSHQPLDQGGMASAGCAVIDLDGDGCLDVTCIGTATANLKWYKNISASCASSKE
jgi:hypothetical protein